MATENTLRIIRQFSEESHSIFYRVSFDASGTRDPHENTIFYRMLEAYLS